MPHPDAARTRDRDIYWSPEGRVGLEHLRLHLGRHGTTANGVVLLNDPDAGPVRCGYQLTIAQDWSLRTARLDVQGGEEPRTLILETDGAGNWRVDGVRANGLKGCHDVDIQVTPFTNSLPIRRLGLAAGESAEIRVVYVPLPSLDIAAAEQRYTCKTRLGKGPGGGGLYHYEGLFRAFAADLPVDADGLVTDYPGGFRRLGGVQR